MKNNVTSFPNNHFGHKPGNGDGGNGMEARVAKLESDVSHIQRDITDIKSDIKEIRNHQRSDFRVLFGALITVALGLAALMAKGFGWL
ncbi:hypothetical protein KW448_08270 [Vibrio fluvialis]|nr:hypothetical protein [Vibrio fluvialis]